MNKNFISFLTGVLLTAGAAHAQTTLKNQKVGDGIYELVYSESDNSVYVASAGSRDVPGHLYRLDATTLTVKDSIAVTGNSPYGLTINPKTSTAYSSNTRSNSVTAFDLKNKKVAGIIQPAFDKSHTRELVADEKNNKIYVSDVGGGSKIWVIDGKKNTLEKVIENTGKSTTGLAVDADQQKLYATNMGTNSVVVIDLKTSAVVDSFATGGESSINLVLDKAKGRLFVANQKSNNVTVIDLKTKQVIKTIPAGEGTLGIAFDEKRNRVYTANRQSGTVTVINAENYDVIDNIKTGGTYPNTVTINKKDGSIYVTNKGQRKRDQPDFKDANGDVVTHIKF